MKGIFSETCIFGLAIKVVSAMQALLPSSLQRGQNCKEPSKNVDWIVMSFAVLCSCARGLKTCIKT